MRETRKVERRDVLRGLLLGAAGGSLAGCTHPSEDPYALPKPHVPGAEAYRPGQEEVKVSACAQCPAGCGIDVRVVEGRAVKIAGHEANPINRGGIGPRGLSGLQVLYDLDRIEQPLRRRTRGGELEPVTWEEALELLQERLGGLRERGEAHRLAVVSGRDRGLLLDLFRRFARAYGTPNVFDGLSRKLGAVAQANHLTLGHDDIPAYDWTSTRYVLSLGAGIMESSCQSIYFTRAAAHLRRGRPGSRAKIVQVEPSPSKTARQADEWISIVPGTHAAFVLGLCHVLVREDLHDAEFVREHCFGFEPWTDEAGRRHLGFWELLLRDHAPDAVASTCGISASVIERVAHEMAAQRPAFAVVDERATMASNGMQVARSVLALNALLGSVQTPGGVQVPAAPPLEDWREVEPDETARASLAQPRVDGAARSAWPAGESALEALPEALLSGEPYPIDTLLLHYSNPAYSGMSPARWREALERVPFIVSFSPFLDETASAVADLVLPDHTYLERWEDAAPAPSTGRPVFGVRQPVVEPLHDTRPTGDVLLEVANGLGGSVGKAFPWKDFRSVLFAAVKDLQEARTGSIVEESFRSFGRELFESGFWWDPEPRHEDWELAFRTPSGRLELFSRGLLDKLESTAEALGTSVPDLLESWGHPPDADVACLPHHVDAAWEGDAERYPFLLEPYARSTHAEGGGANQPLLQELRIEGGHEPWQTTAEIAPETGARLGLRSGDRMEISSPVGKVVVRVHLQPGMRDDVVRVPRGDGHVAYGRWAQGWGANVQELLVPAMDPFTGVPAFLGTRVALREATS